MVPNCCRETVQFAAKSCPIVVWNRPRSEMTDMEREKSRHSAFSTPTVLLEGDGSFIACRKLLIRAVTLGCLTDLTRVMFIQKS